MSNKKIKTPTEVIAESSVKEQAHLQQLALVLFFGGGREEIVTMLEEEDFTSDVLRKFFVACRDHYRIFKSTDPFEVHHSLAGKKWYEELGGLTFILSNFISPEGLIAHSGEVRRVIGMMKEVRSRKSLAWIESALEDFGTGDVAEMIAYVKAKAAEAQGFLPSSVSLSIKDMAKGLQARVVPKVPTGFKKIDETLGGGIANGTLCVIAARPGVGKTTLALNIAANVAQSGKRAMFISLEMSREDVAERFMCGYMGATIEDVRKNADTLFPRIEGDLLIDDSRRTLGALQTAFMYNADCDVFIIDYLQLLTIEGEEKSRIQEVSKLTRELKVIAMDMQKPIILLSQLSRAIERDRHNREPVLSDLRDSGTIEQDADYVTFLWDKSAKKGDGDTIDDEEWGIEETERDIRWIVRKNRYGPPNRSYKMNFKAEHYLFSHKEAGRPPDEKVTIF